jgi:ACS family hexuronate transporter-like MFS transporter
MLADAHRTHSANLHRFAETRMAYSAPLLHDTPGTIPAWKWRVIWLLFLATMINYMDRQTMQVTSSHLIREFFDGKERGYGQVESAFQYAFALSQIVAGFLVDRFNVRWFYVGALLVWSAAGFFTGLVNTIELLILCRIVLGVAEAFNWPCAVSVVRRVLPLEARSLANGIFHSGASIGAAITPLLAWAMIGPNGENWRTIFIVVGAAGAAWAVLWLVVVRGERAREIEHKEPASTSADSNEAGQGPPFRLVLLGRLFWITMMVSLTVNVCWHFFRAWLPRILRKDLEYSESEMLWMVAGFFVAADVGSMLAGYLTRRLTHAGFSVERSRKLVSTGASLLCLLAVPVAMKPEPWLAVPLVLIVAAGAMGGFANMFALAQETAARHTAKVVGIVGSVPWFVLALLNPTIGGLADETGTFSLAVTCVAFVPLLGSLIGWFWPERAGTRYPA